MQKEFITVVSVEDFAEVNEHRLRTWVETATGDEVLHLGPIYCNGLNETTQELDIAIGYEIKNQTVNITSESYSLILRQIRNIVENANYSSNYTRESINGQISRLFDATFIRL